MHINRPAWAYYVVIILRIIGYKFGENNTGIIGCLQIIIEN